MWNGRRKIRLGSSANEIPEDATARALTEQQFALIAPPKLGAGGETR